MKPPLTYFGGKTTIAPRIAAALPEHGHYVEPFAGWHRAEILTGTGQGPDGWSNRTEVLWSNRPLSRNAAPALFELEVS